MEGNVSCVNTKRKMTFVHCFVQMFLCIDMFCTVWYGCVDTSGSRIYMYVIVCEGGAHLDRESESRCEKKGENKQAKKKERGRKGIRLSSQERQSKEEGASWQEGYKRYKRGE